MKILKRKVIETMKEMNRTSSEVLENRIDQITDNLKLIGIHDLVTAHNTWASLNYEDQIKFASKISLYNLSYFIQMMEAITLIKEEWKESINNKQKEKEENGLVSFINYVHSLEDRIATLEQQSKD